MATGWQVQWGLNLGTGTIEEAVAEACAVKAAVGRHLHSFIIGNEVDLLPKYRGNYEGYHAAYRAYQACAPPRPLPDAIFSGPNIAGTTDWCCKFAKTEAADLKQVTHHYYRTGAMKADATIATLLQPHAALATKLDILRQSALANRIGYRINETNSFYGGGKAGVGDTFASALWCLDYLFVLASHGSSGVNMQTDINQLGWVSHYSPIFRGEAGRLTARPSYYGMLAFTRAARGDQFKLTASASQINLTAYGTKEKGGALWVTLINKDLDRNAEVNITLPEGYTRATGLRLAAPTVTSKDGMKLGSASVSDAGQWAAADRESLIATAGLINAVVPKTGALLLRVAAASETQ